MQGDLEAARAECQQLKAAQGQQAALAMQLQVGRLLPLAHAWLATRRPCHTRGRGQLLLAH